MVPSILSLRRILITLMLALPLIGAPLITGSNAEARSSRATRAFVAPNKLFGVKIPTSWSILLHENDPNTYEFRPKTRKNDAFLMIRRIDVPPRAKPQHLLLRAKHQRLNKYPNFKVLKTGRPTIGKLPAAFITATYSYQGNLQYPRVVEELFIVHEKEAFIFHFECFEPDAPALANQINSIYWSFIPRIKPKQLKAFTKPQKKFHEMDNIPY